MQPVTINVNEAFLASKQYAVPSYQRNYVWTQKGQWEPLWDDVRALVRQRLPEESPVKPHFLGTIITKRIDSGVSLLDRWWVVDGQQRLTTLQILMAAARVVLVEQGLDDHAAPLTRQLINECDLVRRDQDRYKITHKSSNYEGFSGIIESSLADGNEPDLARSRLHECHAWFRTQIADWMDGAPEGEREAQARSLTFVLLRLLQFVDIRLDGHENSHAIFEALNARGEPLTEWEKTKNYILSIAVSDYDPDGDGTYQKYLEQYETDAYWEEIVRVPRFTGKRIDLFLFFFLQIELPARRQSITGDAELRSLQRNRLYREFRYVGEHVYKTAAAELDGLLERLKRYATIYRRIDKRDGFSAYARLVMHRRETLNLASLIPVLMVLVDKLGNAEDLDRALGIVDSYLMRRVALKATYSGFDDVAFGHVQALRDAAPEDVCTVLIERFEGSSWTNRWPDDDEIVQHLHEADMYNGISSARKQLLLRGIAQRMHDERGHDLTMSFQARAGLTVEHVAPQAWESHWQDALGFDHSEEGRHRLSRLVHRIGNLTLVTSALNPKLGNAAWSEKAKRLGADNLEMNRRLLEDMEGEVWNEREINRRSQTLANYVNGIWPHAVELRRQLGTLAPTAEADGTVSGLRPRVAQKLVDSVTETGVDEGWADRRWLNLTRRDDRYGRYLRLGGGSRWHGAWFGVSTQHRHLVLDFFEPAGAPECLIFVPEGLAFHEELESVEQQVRQVASSIARDEPGLTDQG